MAAITSVALERGFKDKWERDGLSEYEIGVRVDALSEVTFALFNEYMHSTWAHRHIDVLLTEREKCPSINELGDSIDRYLEYDFLHSPQMDWLLADSIVFSETNATAFALGKTVARDRNGERMLSPIAIRAIWSLICWATWVGLCVAAYMLHPAALVGLLAITGWAQWTKHTQKKKLNDLLVSMADVYGALDNSMPSWRNVYSLMEASRAKGAKWPTPLYRLVEKNIR